MATFAYNTEAEPFLLGNRWSRQQPVAYRRFASAAEAVRFAIEELPPAFFSAPTWRSTKRDSIATEYASCTRAPTIRSPDAQAQDAAMQQMLKLVAAPESEMN